MSAGTIYGVVLNDAEERATLREQFDKPPYNAPPSAPVVYIKPRSCLTEHGVDVLLPSGIDALQASATVALTFVRDVSHEASPMSLGDIAFIRIALDICIPHPNYYRPAIAERCRDGFLPVAAPTGIKTELGDLTIVTEIDGAEAHRWSLSRLVRPIDTLIADLGEFATLRAGDTLLVGLPGDAPLVREGQAIRVTAGALPPLDTRIVRRWTGEAGPYLPPRQIHWAEVSDDAQTLRLPSGVLVEADSAQWLPPVETGATIYALGLNYADHNKELGFAVKAAAPLIFLKGHATLLGHQGFSQLPADADQMHPECELVAIIGSPAKRVAAADALDYVSGYTIANDYAIRNYLENYYRPNARVKNRDATTPLGPWIVNAADVGDPQALALSTSVNGVKVQDGSTADMILSVAGLIEYLSGFLTLMPGDMILTGTPQGVHFVKPGDTVISEIERIGSLVNHIEAGR